MMVMASLSFQQQLQQQRHRRRRTVLIAALAGIAALSLQALLAAPHLSRDYDDDDEQGDHHDIIGANGAEYNNRVLTAMTFSDYDDELIAEDADVLAIPGVQEDILHLQQHTKKEEGEEEEEGGAGGYANGDTIVLVGLSEEAAANETIEGTTAPPSPPPLPPYDELIDDDRPLPPYAIRDAVAAAKAYDASFALLVYDPAEDAFLGLYSRRHYWVSGCRKLLESFKYLSYMLRKNFPERFLGVESDELVIPMSSGDYPQVKTTCLNHFRHEAQNPNTPPGWAALMKKGCTEEQDGGMIAPILHFGSVFRQPYMFPSMIAMPMPEGHHLYCFKTWMDHKAICGHMRAQSYLDVKAELVFGQESGLEWENLIPQVVWRGTDFSYLGKLHPYLQKPRFDEATLIGWTQEQQNNNEIRTKVIGAGLTTWAALTMRRALERLRKRAPSKAEADELRLQEFSKAAAVTALWGQFEKLLPRWKAVVLTAHAEVEAETRRREEGLPPESKPLPWANMKFSSYIQNGSKARTTGSEQYKQWESIGFATGKYMDLHELARYKYHIDLGGGGGTTWAGTVQKLAMPGLLFHHMTPTKDYIHDWMKPWVHFVPVSSDLRDLKRKFDWAESHPEESKKIADEGTKLLRYLTSPEGYEDLFQEDIVQPLKRVIEAYQPIKAIHSETTWRNWKEALRQIEGDEKMLTVIKCVGKVVHDCEKPMGKNWIQDTFSRRNKRHLYGGS